MIKLLTIDNKSPNEAIADILQKVSEKLNKSGKLIQTSLVQQTRRHVQTIYPGSKHYDPAKVQPGQASNGSASEGEAQIDIPGITRAYHDLDIRPKFRQSLTIPMHSAAYGKKASEIDGLFAVKKKDGNAFLAKNIGGSLAFMYFLAKHVHQSKDSRLLPSDSSYADNIFARLISWLQK